MRRSGLATSNLILGEVNLLVKIYWLILEVENTRYPQTLPYDVIRLAVYAA